MNTTLSASTTDGSQKVMFEVVPAAVTVDRSDAPLYDWIVNPRGKSIGQEDSMRIPSNFWDAVFESEKVWPGA